MRDDLIARAEAALEGVTDGPWTFGVRNSRTVQIIPGERPELLRCEPGLAGIALARPRDAEFIAAARTLVPELVAALKTARAQRDEFAAQLDDALKDWTEEDAQLLAENQRLAGELETTRAQLDTLRAGLTRVEHFARTQALSDRVRTGPARSTYHCEERYWLDLLALIERVEVADV